MVPRAPFEHWNGTSWSVVTSPTPKNGGFLSGVTAIASNNVWAVGTVLDSKGAASSALVEHWDGTSWSIVSSSAFTGVIKVGAISADSSSDIWANGTLSSTGAPVALHRSGTTWSQVTLKQTFTCGVGNSILALSPTNVWAVGSGVDSDFDTNVPEIEQWNGTSWSIISSPTTNQPPLDSTSDLAGIAAISANNIWAVGSNKGETLTEHWDGTSWSIITSPDPGPFNHLFAVAALSDRTVVAVGAQEDAFGNANGLILQNAASAPKYAPTAAALATTMPAPLAAVPAMPSGITTASQTRTTPAPLDAGAVGQLFAVAGKADRSLLSAGHTSRGHEPAENEDLDGVPGGM
jgi:hypothetical protein